MPDTAQFILEWGVTRACSTDTLAVTPPRAVGTGEVALAAVAVARR